jgi:hypothetical protein
MTDDPYDKMLDATAADYNRPGVVPREEMWAKIQAARAAAAAPRSFVPPRTRRIWVLPGIGIAALLILSAGILIGRRMGGGTADSTRLAAASNPASPNDSAQPSAVAQTTDTLAHSTRDVATSRDVSRSGQSSAGPAGTASREVAGLPRASGDADADAIAYRLVVLQHLAGTEAAITAFRSAARRGEVDPQVAQWSRELLSTTRMLRSSSLAADPVMRRLLTDLDLILNQIAAYSERGATHPEELDLIEESITKRGIISKLRTTIPARAIPGNMRGL